MNEIFKRTSVRKYTSSEIEKEKIEALLKAAMQSPTAINQQSWEFIVVQNTDALFKLSKLSEHAGCIANAPLVIIILINKNKIILEDRWEMEVGACAENILLEAVSQGLGGVWIGVNPVKERMDYISEMYKLPDYIIPCAVISLGYPVFEKEPASRYDSDKVYYDEYIR